MMTMRWNGTLTRRVCGFLALVMLVVHGSTDAAAARSRVVDHDDKNHNNNDYYSFEDYVREFSKTYNSVQEFERRKAIFQANQKLVQSHNNNSKKKGQQQQFHVLGVNHPYADLLPEELPRGYNKMQSSKYAAGGSAGGGGASVRATARRVLESDIEDAETARLLQHLPSKQLLPVHSLPTHVDWREKGVTTPVKSQGQCGSCWAFASTAVLESHVALKTETLFEFSEQEFVSCAPNPQHCGGAGGCAGSTAELAFEHAMLHGMVQEWDFGYRSYHGEAIACPLKQTTTGAAASTTSTARAPETDSVASSVNRRRRRWLRQNNHVHDNDSMHNTKNSTYYKGAVASIRGYAVLPSNNYTVLMNVVAQMGPVAVSVACLPWHLYRGGIFYAPLNTTRATDIDHLVVLEGYGTDEATGQDYWLIRNSWGPLWGEGGYIRLLRRDPSTMDDPDAEQYCGMDTKPWDGVACTKDESGRNVIPPAAKICGNSGILYDTSIPLGGHLL